MIKTFTKEKLQEARGEFVLPCMTGYLSRGYVEFDSQPCSMSEMADFFEYDINLVNPGFEALKRRMEYIGVEELEVIYNEDGYRDKYPKFTLGGWIDALIGKRERVIELETFVIRFEGRSLYCVVETYEELIQCIIELYGYINTRDKEILIKEITEYLDKQYEINKHKCYSKNS